MTTSALQASCVADVVVCDDTESIDLTGFVGAVGLVVLVLAIGAVVHALRARRRR